MKCPVLQLTHIIDISMLHCLQIDFLLNSSFILLMLQFLHIFMLKLGLYCNLLANNLSNAIESILLINIYFLIYLHFKKIFGCSKGCRRNPIYYTTTIVQHHFL
jgi:hypothetical protein